MAEDSSTIAGRYRACSRISGGSLSATIVRWTMASMSAMLVVWAAKLCQTVNAMIGFMA